MHNKDTLPMKVFLRDLLPTEINRNAPIATLDIPRSVVRCMALGSSCHTKGQRLNSSRKRLVWARLTGISVCFLSSNRNWYELLNQGTTSLIRLMFTR